MTTYRCEQCGNKTRFDVYDKVTRRRFEHADFAGNVNVDEEEVIEREVTRVVCRWCESEDQVVEVAAER